MKNYDTIIIGAGHAGVEASLASAKLGCKTCLFTLSLDQIANMPCNPSIGGTAKGHLVREIDALGGFMGIAADATFLQSRMLNRGKGPAVHSLRVQSDREQYHTFVKFALENQDNLSIKQDEVIDIIPVDDIIKVVTKIGGEYFAKAVVICCGTYQNGVIHIGEVSYSSGPDGVMPSSSLTDNLQRYGITIRRFKTGTPARINRNSIDFTKLSPQAGDDIITPFSFTTTKSLKNQVLCHMGYTNENTHKVIRANLHRSPIYSGRIEAIGPRYCPSIEDKIVRFADKSRHQLFVEPMGLATNEMYMQGMSSSLPLDVQLEFIHTIDGFENAEVMRNAYAIEYDCCDPLELFPTLEFKAIKGLFGAGQFNGTSGYEEAAAQGLIAGINAAFTALKKPKITLGRETSYIGTLIDDLVTKGCSDPYRMLTSRSEYRLILRQDNADERLTPLGYQVGLISKDRYDKFIDKYKAVEQELKRLEKVVIPVSKELNDLIVSRETTPIEFTTRAVELIKRPQLSYADIMQFEKQNDVENVKLPYDVIEQVEIVLKYQGYIKMQLAQVKEIKRLSQMVLDIVDYSMVKGLRLEAVEKLNKIRPLNIAQASRISGVNPADISVILIYIKSARQDGKA